MATVIKIGLPQAIVYAICDNVHSLSALKQRVKQKGEQPPFANGELSVEHEEAKSVNPALIKGIVGKILADDENPLRAAFLARQKEKGFDEPIPVGDSSDAALSTTDDFTVADEPGTGTVRIDPSSKTNVPITRADATNSDADLTNAVAAPFPELAELDTPIVVQTLKSKTPVEFSCLDLVAARNLNSSKGKVSFLDNKTARQNGIIAVPYEGGKVELITEGPFNGEKEIRIPCFLDEVRPCEVVIKCVYSTPEKRLKPKHTLLIPCTLNASNNYSGKVPLFNQKFRYPSTKTINLENVQIVPLEDGKAIGIKANKPFNGEEVVKLPVTMDGHTGEPFQLVLKITYKK